MLATLLRSYVFWVLVALLAALQYVGSMDLKDNDIYKRKQCEMMRTWQDSGGTYGWPIDHKWYRRNC